MVPIGYLLLHHCLCGNLIEISVGGIKRNPYFRITRMWVPFYPAMRVKRKFWKKKLDAYKSKLYLDSKKKLLTSRRLLV